MRALWPVGDVLSSKGEIHLTVNTVPFSPGPESPAEEQCPVPLKCVHSPCWQPLVNLYPAAQGFLDFPG